MHVRTVHVLSCSLWRYLLSYVQCRGCVQGSSWLHVPSNERCVAISAGSEGQVWTLGQSGAVYYRQPEATQTLTGTYKYFQLR